MSVSLLSATEPTGAGRSFNLISLMKCLEVKLSAELDVVLKSLVINTSYPKALIFTGLGSRSNRIRCGYALESPTF